MSDNFGPALVTGPIFIHTFSDKAEVAKQATEAAAAVLRKATEDVAQEAATKAASTWNKAEIKIGLQESMFQGSERAVFACFVAGCTTVAIACYMNSRPKETMTKIELTSILGLSIIGFGTLMYSSRNK